MDFRGDHTAHVRFPLAQEARFPAVLTGICSVAPPPTPRLEGQEFVLTQGSRVSKSLLEPFSKSLLLSAVSSSRRRLSLEFKCFQRMLWIHGTRGSLW